jgi:hypothetical protein
MTALTTSATTVTVGPIVLNSIDVDGVKWTIDVDGFDGWGVPRPSLTVVPKTRQPGGQAGVSFTGPRPMALRGLITAPTPALLTRALDALCSAVSENDTRFQVAEASAARWCTVRRSDEVILRRLNYLIARYAFQVVAIDPRKLGATVTATTALPSTSGGLTVPYTIPYSINAAQVTGQISVTNVGNVAGPVFGRVDGPCVGPVITHGSQVLSLPLLTLGAGEWLDIDFEKREVLANGQASRNTFIGTRGWADFIPGRNTYSFTAASYTAGARLTITATSADK